MNGRLVILSGPSGVGKDTVIAAWRAADPRVERVVACTTREPREGEVAGVDYTFLSRDEFLARAEQGAFLEFKEVFGNLYGTPLSEVARITGEGRIAVLKIDVQGALAVMEKRPDAVSVFLLPPSQEELERRIRGRATDSEETIRKRLAGAEREMAEAHKYQHRIVNGDLNVCVAELMKAVGV